MRGTLVKRYKRFLADIILDNGDEITAHCANPGAMLGLNMPGLICWVSTSNNPKRKLKHSLELVEIDGALVGINTSYPNRIGEQAIRAGAIPELIGYETLRREVKYGANSRIDILLSDDARADCYVEIKNVHLMRQPGLAEFPDCVTARGAKHLVELSDMVARGYRAVMLFIVQRPDCTRFATASDIDAAYHAGLLAARDAGVEVLCYDCDLSLERIALARPLPWQDAAR